MPAPPPHDATDPADLGIVEGAAMLRARRLSSRELTAACLQRIEARNGGAPTFDGAPGAINAWARIYPEIAEAGAADADERLSREREAAPLLCGIPLGLKDLYAVDGLPLTASSRVLEGDLAEGDAVAWMRLRGDGMVLLGHTHTHEFAAGGTTDQVGNPWAPELTAGGSSGGSAAALAARMTPAALGSDTCGSLRIPAACCGISSIKPSHGRVPLDRVIPLAPSLDHAGPMARTIADCAALLGALAAGGAATTPLAPPPAPIGELSLVARAGSAPLAGVTVALTDRSERIDLHPRAAAALDVARSACEALGARVVQRAAPAAGDMDAVGTILMAEAWGYHARHRSRRDRYRPSIAEFLEVASASGDVGAYLAAQRGRVETTALWERWFDDEGIDLVLEPTLPVVPFARGDGYERGHAGGPGDPMIALTALWDMTGMPVAALPVTWDAGVSLIAPRGREAALVTAAIDVQEHALGVPAWEPPGAAPP